MYKIFEKIYDNMYQLVYSTDDFQFACEMLNAFKGKYIDKKFILCDEVN